MGALFRLKGQCLFAFFVFFAHGAAQMGTPIQGVETIDGARIGRYFGPSLGLNLGSRSYILFSCVAAFWLDMRDFVPTFATR